MLLKTSKFFLYTSIFAVLIVMPSTFFPFIGGKDYFFRFSVELAVIFFVLWWAFEVRDGETMALFKKNHSEPVFVAVSIFVLVFILATLFAYDSHSAFWSNYERGEGGFQMIHYYLFFALLALLFDTGEDWSRLFKTSMVAAVLMILYGVFANLGWADTFISPYQGSSVSEGWWQRLTAGRFQGSLGHPTQVAPYLLFSIFYVCYLWSASRIKNKMLSHFGHAALILFFIFFFLISQTRGALLGLGTAITVFFVYLISSIPKVRKWLVVGLVFFLMVGGSLIYFKQSDFVKHLPGGRIFEISTSEDSVNTRLWTWGSAWQGFKERPLLGWGAENFSAVFDKHFDARHFVPGKNTETWFDRAHSLYFDALAETGILGVLSYFGIFGVIFWQCFKRRNEIGQNGVARGELKRKQSRQPQKNNAQKSLSGATGELIKKALILALPIGYLVQGLAIYDVFPVYINTFLFFAFCHYYFSDRLAQQ